MGLVATAGLLAVTGATLGADGPETVVAFANTGRGAIGDAAIEDKNAEASDNAAEAAGGRIGATGVTPTTWAIAADASDKATEACSIADPTVQDAGKVVTVTVTVSFWGKLRRGKGCDFAHHHEGLAQICLRGVLRRRDELGCTLANSITTRFPPLTLVIGTSLEHVR